MERTLTIDGKTFELVRVQRGGASFVYKGADGYLRIGDPRIIKKHLDAHTLMEEAGFPVPSLISQGEREGLAYFIETATSGKRLGDAFSDDFDEDNKISDIHFAQLLGIVERYARLQLKAPAPPSSLRDMKAAIHVRTLSRELPAYATRIQERYAEIRARLSVYPTVLSHGDFNPQNLFENGIIDLEHAFQGPWGYDSMTALLHIDQFPDAWSYEYFARYRYSERQRREFLTMLDGIARDNNLPPLSKHLLDFEFCRACWSSVRMQEWPKLQKWRYDMFIRRFLS